MKTGPYLSFQARVLKPVMSATQALEVVLRTITKIGATMWKTVSSFFGQDAWSIKDKEIHITT